MQLGDTTGQTLQNDEEDSCIHRAPPGQSDRDANGVNTEMCRSRRSLDGSEYMLVIAKQSMVETCTGFCRKLAASERSTARTRTTATALVLGVGCVDRSIFLVFVDARL